MYMCMCLYKEVLVGLCQSFVLLQRMCRVATTGEWEVVGKLNNSGLPGKWLPGIVSVGIVSRGKSFGLLWRDAQDRHQWRMVNCRMTSHLENLEKSGNLTLVREKSGTLGKVGEIVVCLWCLSHTDRHGLQAWCAVTEHISTDWLLYILRTTEMSLFLCFYF